MIAAWSIALPHIDSSQLAEVWGARLAIDLLLAHQHLDIYTSAIIAGDNPPAIRFCHGTGRITSASTHAIIDEALTRLTVAGANPHWRLIRRTVNVRAHTLATLAARRAHMHTSTHAIIDCSQDCPR